MSLCPKVKVGLILLDDGLIELRIKEIKGKQVHREVVVEAAA